MFVPINRHKAMEKKVENKNVDPMEAELMKYSISEINNFSREKIKSFLRKGDQKLIADLSHYDPETVKKNFSESDKRNTPRVLHVARQLLISRKLLYTNLQNN
jgi:hypothetical protein